MGQLIMQLHKHLQYIVYLFVITCLFPIRAAVAQHGGAGAAPGSLGSLQEQQAERKREGREEAREKMANEQAAKARSLGHKQAHRAREKALKQLEADQKKIDDAKKKIAEQKKALDLARQNRAKRIESLVQQKFNEYSDFWKKFKELKLADGAVLPGKEETAETNKLREKAIAKILSEVEQHYADATKSKQKNPNILATVRTKLGQSLRVKVPELHQDARSQIPEMLDAVADRVAQAQRGPAGTGGSELSENHVGEKQ